MTGGTGSSYAVYEVVDSNPSAVETAQIPAFLVAATANCTGAITPSVTAALAPVSNVSVATATDAIPRFIAMNPASDCTQLNDCGASYIPALTADTTPIKLTGSSKGDKQSALLRIGNSGAGLLYYSTSVQYQTGQASGWLTLTPSAGVNGGTIQVIADPSGLQQGTYNATITVSTGAYGSATIPVTFTVGAQGVTITSIGNAASWQYGTVAPGSYAVLFGANLAGRNVSVTFNSLPATVIYDSASQINLIVPTGVGGQLAALVNVTVDGLVSNSYRVNLAPNVPGIFDPGIINVTDGTVNNSDHRVAGGDFISIYMTGLTVPVTGQVTVNIGGFTNLIPTYAGAQPTLPALDQVNVQVPRSVAAGPNFLPVQVCIPGTNGQPVCSNQVNLYLR